MLMNFIWCTALHTKEMIKLCTPTKLMHIQNLADSGTEFKDKLLAHVVYTLGKKQIHTPLYNLQGNRQIENV